ncbi:MULTISPECIES: hypothetical protein [Kitasatospora]|uniref:DNA topoisomerase (ATP-hydrolyzing) n=1 Tax=Kitasatospora setae (strain ATCC 33774 / DSM 43861 / JCM 3304 / KCC A-0304 / NBRC 14216 / KM-6054) TaxID=452652 RepID=E4N889_KITSK|nr:MULTISPECIES: hypothetical protein [Kitasatospora]BAJ27420.1 hypothetical protein KSE_15930 [Kitasatospora setae KM-6054]
MGGTLDLALSWTGHGGLHGYANSRPTSEGTHLQGLHDALRAVLGRTAPPAALTAVVSVKLDVPEFGGATRRHLDNAPARACVADAVRPALEAWLAEHPQPAAE